MNEDFERFWLAYPRRVGKGDARKAFDKAMRLTTLQTILDALVWQVTQPAWTKDDGEFVPYPATYLRAERWADEPFILPNRTQARIDELKQFKEDRQRERERA